MRQKVTPCSEQAFGEEAFYRFNRVLGFSIGLWVVRRGRDVLKHPGFRKHCEFSGNKLRAVVGYEYVRDSIPSEYRTSFL